MSILDGSVSRDSDSRLDSSLPTTHDHNSVEGNPVFTRALRSGNDVTSISPLTNLSENTPSDEGNDDTWKIIVGVLVPLTVLIVVIVVIAYLMYRKKYPVRMIIGREFAKIRNPNYEKPTSDATLVREDAGFYFSSQRGSVTLNLNDYNPVNSSIHYVNMGYQRDEEEVAEDEEDSADKEFRLRKGWLFKNQSEENQVKTINEIQENERKINSGSGSDHGSGSESSDIEAMLSRQETTPIPGRKQKRASSSDEEKHKSLSNVSVSSKDIEVNVQDEEIKLNAPYYIANNALLREAGKEAIDVKSMRSQSLSHVPSETQIRPRSFSVDPSKSARRYSVRKESMTKSESSEEKQNSARQYVTASIVEVIVKSNIFPSVFPLSNSVRNYAESLSPINSNTHLVTDLDENESDSEKNKSEKEMDAEIDETNNIFLKNSSNNGGVSTNDLRPSLPEKENAKPMEISQDVSNVNADFVSKQHDESSANSGGSSDNFICKNAKDQVSNKIGEKQNETMDFLKKCSSKTPDDIKESDTFNGPDNVLAVDLETQSLAIKESTSVEIQDKHLITDSNLQYDISAETRDNKSINTMTPNNSEIEKGIHYPSEQKDKQRNMSGIDNENANSLVVLKMHSPDPVEDTFQSQSFKTLEHSPNVLDKHSSQVQDTSSSTTSSITISRENEDNPLTMTDLDKQFSSLVRNDHQNTIIDEKNDSSIVIDGSFPMNNIKTNEKGATGEEQHNISHLNALVEIIEHSDTNLNLEKQHSMLYNESKHSLKQADTVSEVIIIEGNGDENLSDDSDQQSSTSNSSSDGHFEEYSFLDHSDEPKYDQHKEIEYTPTSDLDRTQILVIQPEIKHQEDASVDIKSDSNGHDTTSLTVVAQDLTSLGHNELSQAEKVDNDGTLYKDYSEHGKNVNKSTDEKQSFDWFKDKYENLVGKTSETKLQHTEKIKKEDKTFHSDDNSSISSNDVSVDEDISLSDIEDLNDLDTHRGRSAVNKMDNENKSLGTIDEDVDESQANLQNIDSKRMTSLDQVSPKEEKALQPQSLLRIIPTLQFSEESSDSDNDGPKPNINVDTHPLYNPMTKYEDDKTHNEFTMEDINEALNTAEKTLSMTDTSLANQNLEHDDVSFSFEIAKKTYYFGKDNNGDNNDDDDIDV